MSLRVAIASENSETDGELYRLLLERVLQQEVVRFDLQPSTFSGWWTVYSLAATFLKQAHVAGVRHAVLAIDNDGGAKRYPEHDDGEPALLAGLSIQQLIKSEGCRTCSLRAAVPGSWSEDGGRTCIVVPVQTLETWILHINGHEFKAPCPEKYYGKSALKAKCYSDAYAPASIRLKIAKEAFARPDALTKLRDRKSFRAFEEQVRAWNLGA